MTIRRVAMAVLATLICASTLAVGALMSRAAADDTGGALTLSKKVTRIFDNGDSVENVDDRTVSVTIDKTTDLRGRERVQLSWTGAHPSGGRASDPYGPNGLRQEYPMMIMQCRGTPDEVTPQTCWTSTWGQRSKSEATESRAIWRRDKYADPADTQTLSGVDPFPSTSICDGLVPAEDSIHLTPFKAAKGTVFNACNTKTMPPEASVDSGFPAAEVAAFTDTDGKGSANFEVRSDVENESLGCSQKVACSIVVIPIEGLSCGPAISGNDPCRNTGQFEPGSSNFANEGVDAAVSPVYWWSASNWRNRISIPVTFGPSPNFCSVLDNRAPVGIFGSELMSQAALQWAPSYCLDPKRFKFQANAMPDDAAFDLMTSNQAAAAFISGNRTSDKTIGYAPTAITGFAIGYVIDEPDNAGEVANLKLTPRLIAKLLSNSYQGGTFVGTDGKFNGHPGMEQNPKSINQDPEFQALNPGLTHRLIEPAAALMSLSTTSDVLKTLTAYINHDQEAKDFLNGNPDPWGMIVNPSFKSIELPRNDWPLNDTWPEATSDSCRKQNGTPFFTQLAAPVSALRPIAEALLDAWPLAQRKAEYDASTSLCKYGRSDRQGIGSRLLLGVVSVPDARRLGIRTAALQTSVTSGVSTAFTDDSGRTFVAPMSASMAEAIKAAKAGSNNAAFTLDPSNYPAAAYPGTMIVYTASLLSGLTSDQAKQISTFIKIATSEGQVAGRGNGQLPDGYLPLTNAGVTQPLWKQAQTVAALVAKAADPAKAAKTAKTKTESTPKPEASASAAAADAAADGKGGSDKPAAGQVLALRPTAAENSGLAAMLVPLLILGAALGAVVAPAIRMFSFSDE
jgi:hypothetical protein